MGHVFCGMSQKDGIFPSTLQLDLLNSRAHASSCVHHQDNVILAWQIATLLGTAMNTVVLLRYFQE
jgi:hypothetical protein